METIAVTGVTIGIALIILWFGSGFIISYLICTMIPEQNKPLSVKDHIMLWVVLPWFGLLNIMLVIKD